LLRFVFFIGDKYIIFFLMSTKKIDNMFYYDLLWGNLNDTDTKKQIHFQKKSFVTPYMTA
jgi:hypothetical protein